VISHIDGYAFLDHIDSGNFSESVKLSESIEAYEERFGEKPKDIAADLIYGNRKNRKKLKKDGIKAGFKLLGERPKLKKE